MNSSEPFTRESATLGWLGEQGDPGWKVTRFEGNQTLGEPTFPHINTLARLPEATRGVPSVT